jgi:hypothetical protein
MDRAVAAESQLQMDVKKYNGSSSYIPTEIIETKTKLKVGQFIGSLSNYNMVVYDYEYGGYLVKEPNNE